MDVSRLDLVVQYALAVSSDALGPLHLLKYVYLADVAYAATHQGETFTRAPWTFLHFGPFDGGAKDRVEAAASAIGAKREERARTEDGSKYVRFRLDDERLAERLRDQLPAEVATAVRHGVREHGGDTSSLLHEVYTTEPMLRAAPASCSTSVRKRSKRPITP